MLDATQPLYLLQCILAAMIVSVAVDAAAWVVWPFRESLPGVSAEALRKAILGGFLCLLAPYVVLVFYEQWKATLAGPREAELATTPSSSTSASDLV
jgi:hypothetical protein